MRGTLALVFATVLGTAAKCGVHDAKYDEMTGKLCNRRNAGEHDKYADALVCANATIGSNASSTYTPTNRPNATAQSTQPLLGQPFAIWITGRVGSSWLVELLNTHPNIVAMGEHFNSLATFKPFVKDAPANEVLYEKTKKNNRIDASQRKWYIQRQLCRIYQGVEAHTLKMLQWKQKMHPQTPTLAVGSVSTLSQPVGTRPHQTVALRPCPLLASSTPVPVLRMACVRACVSLPV